MAKITVEEGILKTKAGSGQVADESGKPKALDFEYPVGADLDEAVQLYGAEVVYDHYVKSANIAVQNFVRNQLEAGKSDELILEAVSKYKLGEDTKDPMTSALKAVDKMTDEEAEELLKKIAETRAAKAAQG